MYFEDLSEYTYYQQIPFKEVRNVGWLDAEHSYRMGNVPAGFVQKLAQIMSMEGVICVHVNRIRGVHPCNLCGADLFDNNALLRSLQIGSIEIWIPRGNGGFFAAPSMLVHYVVEHGYLPPAEFVEAVLAFDLKKPLNAQVEYKKLASRAMVVARSEGV